MFDCILVNICILDQHNGDESPLKLSDDCLYGVVHKVIDLFIYVLCILPNQKMLMTEGLNILYCVCWGVFFFLRKTLNSRFSSCKCSEEQNSVLCLPFVDYC